MKVQYPEKCAMLLVRDCTVAICCNNNPGSVLLSTFLFWHDHPRTGDYYDEKTHTFTMCRTQAEIQIQSCNQIDTKTIHDTAVPLLQLFGYLTVKEKMNGNLYTLHMDRINAAYAVCRNPQTLHQFLKSSLQLESAPIRIAEAQLEPTLINKRALYFQLARVLIVTRADSYCKRGRKPKQQAPSDDNFPPTENKREFLETSNRENEEENDPPPSSPPEVFHSSHLNLNSMSSLKSSSQDERNHHSSNQDDPIVTTSSRTHDENSTVEPPNSDAPPEGLYEGENRDGLPRGDNVHGDLVETAYQNGSTNSTVLLSWLKALEQEETGFGLGRIASNEKAMGRLSLVVSSMDVVRDLYKIVRKRFKNGIIWAKNLADENVIAELQESCWPAPLQPLTEASRNGLIDEIVREHPTLWLQAANDEIGLILLIWHGDDKADYTLIQFREDWDALRKNEEMIKRAVAYAASQQQVEVAPQSREFGMTEAVCNGLMDIIHKWSPALKLEKKCDPELSRWTVHVFFGSLDYQYFEVENHAAWYAIKQEDTAMLECAVQYGQSLQEMVVAI